MELDVASRTLFSQLPMSFLEAFGFPKIRIEQGSDVLFQPQVLNGCHLMDAATVRSAKCCLQNR